MVTGELGRPINCSLFDRAWRFGWPLTPRQSRERAMTALRRRWKVTKKPNRLNDAIIEIADDMHRLGIMDSETRQKIMLRDIGKPPASAAEPISGEEP
jgi:hypothetical protein